MNLIEQLGGYEKAKEMYTAQLKAGIAPYGYEEALLQYCREHNIFEVGDKVVFKAHFKGEWRSGFGEITYIDNDLEGVAINNNVLVAISEIEHATDEEIKAGHKL